MAAPALDVDKEAVRMLVLQIGCREAARQMNIDENTVLQWSARGSWLKDLPRSQPLPKSMQPIPVINVIKAPDAHLNVTRNLQVRGRLAGLRKTTAVLEHLETEPIEKACTVPGIAVLNGAINAAAKAGGWDATTPITATDLRLVANEARPVDDHGMADADGMMDAEVIQVQDDQSVDLL